MHTSCHSCMISHQLKKVNTCGHAMKIGLVQFSLVQNLSIVILIGLVFRRFWKATVYRVGQLKNDFPLRVTLAVHTIKHDISNGCASINDSPSTLSASFSILIRLG